MKVSVKICGCNSREAIGTAVASGADYVGLVFYPPSPRSLTAEAAAPLAQLVPERILRVGLFVDPDDETLRRVTAQVKLDLVQLHGSETPDRVAAIKRLTGLPATNLGLEGRGFLMPGMFADVVVFDPATIADRATYENPRQYAVGVKHVFVNGAQVLKDGEHTGAKPGRAVWGPGKV